MQMDVRACAPTELLRRTANESAPRPRRAAGAFADRLQELLQQKLEQKEIAAGTYNHLRAGVFRIFESARDPKRRL